MHQFADYFAICMDGRMPNSKYMEASTTAELFYVPIGYAIQGFFTFDQSLSIESALMSTCGMIAISR